jgi:8-oxo-dGTP diphosphatase
MADQPIMGKTIDGKPATMTREKLIWRPGAYGIILNDAGKLLVLDNIKTDLYDLPGGGIELWEDIETALVREIWEETGLTATINELVDLYDRFFLTPAGRNWHTINIYYRATMVEGELRSSIIEDEWSLNPHWVDPAPLTAQSFTHGQACLDAVMKVVNRA